MINVPERVKDALRSGEYKKNYKISVGDWGNGWVDIANGVSTYTTEFTGQFFVYAFEVNNVKFKIQKPNEEGSQIINLYNVYPNPIEKLGYSDSFPAGTVFTLLDISPAGKLLNVSKQGQVFVEDFTLENDALVSESVKIDERMCSGSELKFGLCEGTSVEFQYSDEYQSIYNRALNIYIDVQYKDADSSLKWYSIPLGLFTVQECSRQASTGLHKVIAYNKLKSEYLNQDCTAKITELISNSPSGLVPLADVLDSLMSDYAIDSTSYENIGGGYIYNPVINYTTDAVRIYEADGTEYEIPVPFNPRYDPAGTYFGIFTVDFYYIPQGESSAQTNDSYFYSIDFSTLWGALQNKLDVAWQKIPDSLNVFVSFENQWKVKEGDNYIAIPDSLYAGQVTLQNGALPSIYIRDHKNDTVQTALFTGYYPKFTIATLVKCDLTSSGAYTAPGPWQNIINQASNAILQAMNGVQLATIYKYHGPTINSVNIGLDNLKNKVTLRDLQSAAFEVNCQYGKLDRVTDLFAGIELNNASLYPRDNLYPADSLYPQGQSESGYPSMYSKLWADEGNVRSFRNLIITYKSTEIINGQTQEVEKTLQRTVNANGTDDYNMSDNWLFKNLVWSDANVGSYADAMVAKMQNIRWFPFEMWCAGLPFIEAGDEILITGSGRTVKLLRIHPFHFFTLLRTKLIEWGTKY